MGVAVIRIRNNIKFHGEVSISPGAVLQPFQESGLFFDVLIIKKSKKKTACRNKKFLQLTDIIDNSNICLPLLHHDYSYNVSQSKFDSLGVYILQFKLWYK